MKKHPIIVSLVLAFFLLVGSNVKSFSQSDTLNKKHYIIYDTKKKQIINLDDIVKDFKDYDVIFFGEEHDDSIAHYLQNLLYEKLYAQYGNKMALSLEMFERGSQMVLDEYLKGYIKESYFVKDAQAWKNYKDYRPMVEFSKENKLSVIAANAAWRYVNMINKEGMEALNELSDVAKTCFAPVPFKGATGGYAEKLSTVMRHNPSDTGEAPKLDFTIERYFGQSLWDATMAYSVFEHLSANPGKKILHLNGRFHTDEFYGIVPQLKNYNPNIKLLVISSGKDRTEKYPEIDFAEYESLGDYVIITDISVKSSY